MTWYLLLGPFAVLVILSLFGFVGCSFQAGAAIQEPGPDYPSTIEATPGLVAYWRLGEPSTTTVPSSGGAAKSEVGPFNGDYFKLARAATDAVRHSPGTAGTITLGAPGYLNYSRTVRAST